MHASLGILLSVYVDDFRMVGKKGTLAPMWAQLRTHLDIDPPTDLDGSVYLCVKMHHVPPDMSIVSEKRNMYQSLFRQQDVSTGQRSGNELQGADGATPA